MIFFIIGKSGSGKDTIMKGVLEEINKRPTHKKEKKKEKETAKKTDETKKSDYTNDISENTEVESNETKELDRKLKPLVGYTTRPMREGEVEGVEYHFVSNNTRIKMKLKKNILEQRVYITTKGKWYYFTANDDQLKGMDDLIMVGPLKQYEELNKKVGTPVIPIYIKIDSKTRKKRLMHRESLQENPNYSELERRFKADENDFLGVENIANLIEVDNNGSLKSAVATTVKYINNILDGYDKLRMVVMGFEHVDKLTVTEYNENMEELIDKPDDKKDTFEISKKGL